MTLSGRPLLDSRRDAGLFVGRDEELERLGTALAEGLNCVVVGDRGSGKSSLVRALMYRSRRPDDEIGLKPVLVHGAAATSAGDLLAKVTSALTVDTSQVPGYLSGVTAENLLEELRGMGSTLQSGTVVVVDDVPTDVGNILFGTLRDELWAAGITWLVTTADPGALLRPPADAFFEVRVDLEDLPHDVAVDLLARRLSEEPQERLTAVVAAAGGHPRRMLDLAREVTLGGTWPDVASGSMKRARKLAEVGRPGNMLFAELQSLGSASASDEQLQKRMGWTRPRLVQVLGELEDAGLVTGEMARPLGGKGRPRKVYTPVPVGTLVRRRLRS